MKYLIFTITLFFSHMLTAQVDSAKVYWVGHSLMSHTDAYSSGTDNLINLMGTIVSSQSKTYDFYQHTTPGAPIGWNWGANPDAWASSQSLIQPLINTSNPNYGSYDVMIVTEGVNLDAISYWWHSDFYSRKFYNAAKNANSSTRLFMYESWHHFFASDEEFRPLYGPMSTFDWKAYMLSVRPIWEDIMDKASDPALTVTDPDYSFQGTGTDPGNGSDILDINIIPTGQVLISVLDRLAQNLPTDNWNYNGSSLTSLDFFYNPLVNWPIDTITPVHPADPLDDIHPSNVLIYLNGLVHYAVIYQEDPVNIPPLNGVPSNIADIFKEVAWDVVINDPRTGVSEALPVSYLEPFNAIKNGEQVKLSWSTVYEDNSDYFIVEKSKNIEDWKRFTKIKSKNQSKTSLKYQAIDNHVDEGMTYYRLKQVDKDGSFSYSNIEKINFERNHIEIYPNPSTGIIHISNTNLQNGTIRIIDIIGNVVFTSKDLNQNSTINLSHLPNGIYYLSFQDKATNLTQKIMLH